MRLEYLNKQRAFPWVLSFPIETPVTEIFALEKKANERGLHCYAMFKQMFFKREEDVTMFMLMWL